jgi:outer membrane receptor protein involved in Fe transport
MPSSRFLSSSSFISLALLLAATPSLAQEAGSPGEGADEPAGPVASGGDIVVTGSRISQAGYQAPTPVTVIGEEQILRDARPSIGDTIRELPAVGSSNSPSNGQGSNGIVAGTSGMDTINLRQLGTTRTLVLFDGQRVVASNINGAVDIGTIPTMLVQRIDVVTAGASASWGSDAVSGVVNLVLNKRFTGIRLSADYGNTHEWDYRRVRAQGAAGTSFDGGRGHLIVAGTHQDSPQTVFAGQRDWNRYPALMLNPAYTPDNAEPRYITVNNVGLSQATTGGLITAGPLRGIQFVGANADPVEFDFGQVNGPLSFSGDQEQFLASFVNLNSAFKQSTLFGYASYEFQPWLRVSAQLNYGRTDAANASVPLTRLGNLTIRRDNPFIPVSIQGQMDALGLTSLRMGTTNLNNIPMGSGYTLERVSNTVGIPTAFLERELKRGVISLDGDIGSDWSWDAYYQRGELHFYQETTNNHIDANYDRAIDAVVAPVGNTAGIAPGTIVCRSTLTDPTNGCAPLNIFGFGVASQAAIDYVNVKPGQNWTNQNLVQEVFAASVQGVLPFGLPAGPVAVAAGAEHRSEKARSQADQGAINRIYAQGNFAPFRGSYNVKEAFLEVDVPLLSDSIIPSLSLNAAGRVTDYSTSGRVETWKLGLTGELNSDIRFRGTISRDIRAPILNELFSSGVATSGSAVDPNTGENVQIFTFASGNRNLTPEIARTYSAGVVLSPGWLGRVNVAVDYYNISITDAIASVGASQVLQRCNAGETSFCSQLVFGAPGGVLSQINTFPQNVASLKVDGIDFQADYSVPLLAGTLSARLVGNYVLNQSQNNLGTRIEYAGAVSADNGVSGTPRARANASATYDAESWSLTGQVRFIGAAKLVYDWTSKDVDRNKVPAIAYVDLRGSYDVFENVQIFGTVDNLLNQAPPMIPGTFARGQGVYYGVATDGSIYDMLGRSYRLGIRMDF